MDQNLYIMPLKVHGLAEAEQLKARLGAGLLKTRSSQSYSSIFFRPYLTLCVGT